MEARKYSRHSLMGRVYGLIHGGDYGNATSCDVRRSVLQLVGRVLLIAYFSAMLGAVLWFGPSKIWSALVWIYDVIVSGKILWLLQEALVAAVFCLVFLGMLAFVMWIFDSIGKSTKKALKSNAIVMDFWDDVYHKVCKPVEWIE